jgi:transcriptional regulator with XRE-family HTH domain
MSNDLEMPIVDRRVMRLNREKLGLTQGQIASRLGLSLRAYQDMESGTMLVRQSHFMALRLLTLIEAVERGDRSLATQRTAALADAFAKLPASSQPQAAGGKLVNGEPPVGADGLVVCPSPSLPQYLLTTVAGYYALDPGLRRRTVPINNLDAMIDKAMVMTAGDPSSKVFVVAAERPERG